MSVPGVMQEKRQQRTEQAKRIMLARFAGEFDVLQTYFSPDISMSLIGNRALTPFGGTYNGIAEVRRIMMQIAVEFEFTDVRIKHLLIDGDQTGLHWGATLRNRGTSVRDALEGFTILVFEDDLVKRYIAFTDTASISQLAARN